jgi:hypothetical protein
MRPRLLLVVVPLLLAPVLSMAGQQATVAGTVRDDSTGRPIAGAEVLIEALGRRTATDPEGRFVLGGVSPGLRLVLVRSVGFHPLSLMITVSLGDTAQRDIRLKPMAVHLDPIVVTGAPPPGPRGIGREAFEERRRLGFGRFIDSTELRRNEHVTLPTMLRRGTGVHIRRAGTSDFGRGYAMSSRIPECYMSIFLDGWLVYAGGRRGANPTLGRQELSELASVSNLEAVEIYRSPAEIPTQFSGPDAACGVLVLWTRRGP